MEENNMHFKKISLTLLSIFILSLASSCNQSKNTGSSTISSSPTPIEYPSLKEAIENTQEYAITLVGREEDPEWFFEIMLDDFYYYDPAGEGYIFLEEDPNYFHAVTKTTHLNQEGNAYYELNVHGRRGPLSLIQNYYSYRLIDIIDRYVDDFTQVDENLWSCSVAQLGSELRNYFQADSLRYSNYFEIEIGEDGKISKFTPYEVSTQGEYKMAKVSIIIPIYNTEKYIKKCLDSVIAQTLEDIEIICVNDGSTDSSLSILEQYSQKDPRITIINKTNSGYGHSMNLGIDSSTGEYIGIVEADDFVNPEMFEELYRLASENQADMVKSDFYYYLDKRSRKAGKIAKNKCFKVFNVKDDNTILKMMPSIWSAIYKREFLKENNIRFLETAGASYQDTSFAFKTLASAGRIVFTDRAYYNYRQDNESSSVQSKGKVYAICDEWEEITKYVNERPEIKKEINDIKLSTQFNAYRWNTMRIDEKYRDEFIEKYSKTFKEYYNNEEIKQGFFKKASKNELKLLLFNKPEYKKLINALALKKDKKAQRQKAFSVRINPSRVSIVLFNKHLVEIG